MYTVKVRKRYAAEPSLILYNIHRYVPTYTLYVCGRVQISLTVPAPILFKFCRIRDEFVLSSGTEDPTDLATSARPAKILAMIIYAQYAYYRHARRVGLYDNIILCKIVCVRRVYAVVRPLKIFFFYIIYDIIALRCLSVYVCIIIYVYRIVEFLLLY